MSLELLVNQAVQEDPAGCALCFQENGCRQKSQVCEAFDRLFALLEDRKCDMIVRITAEQEEKLDYIRGLRRKHSEHLENSAKLLETAIQTLDESEMALFLQVSSHSAEAFREPGKTSRTHEPPAVASQTPAEGAQRHRWTASGANHRWVLFSSQVTKPLLQK